MKILWPWWRSPMDSSEAAATATPTSSSPKSTQVSQASTILLTQTQDDHRHEKRISHSQHGSGRRQKRTLQLPPRKPPKQLRLFIGYGG